MESISRLIAASIGGLMGTFTNIHIRSSDGDLSSYHTSAVIPWRCKTSRTREATSSLVQVIRIIPLQPKPRPGHEQPVRSLPRNDKNTATSTRPSHERPGQPACGLEYA